MAVDDIVGLQAVGRLQSQNIVNTFSYQITGQTETEQEILGTLCAAWGNQLSAAWLARMCDDYELIGVRAYSLSGDNKIPGVLLMGSNGDVVEAAAPAYVCRVLTLYTESGNYRRRGRVNLSGTTTPMLDDTDGSIIDAEITALGTLAGLLNETLVVDDESFQPVLAPTDVLPVENIVIAVPRKTPSIIRSRRIKQMFIG